MSNLGMYQRIVEVSKVVGGPEKLIALIASGGFALGVAGTKLTEAVRKHLKSSNEAKVKEQLRQRTYKVAKDALSNEGLRFREGDEVRVLEVDGDAALIEKINDDNNPYFVSAGFLGEISDYE